MVWLVPAPIVPLSHRESPPHERKAPDPVFHHDIHFTHTRHPLSATFDVPEASSAMGISVDSNDLVEALSELIGRMPEDVKDALKVALMLTDK